MKYVTSGNKNDASVMFLGNLCTRRIAYNMCSINVGATLVTRFTNRRDSTNVMVG